MSSLIDPQSYVLIAIISSNNSKVLRFVYNYSNFKKKQKMFQIMLFILIQLNLVFTKVPFSEIAKHKHHIPCNQLQDAKDYLDMIQHKEQLMEDSKILGSYISTSSEFSRKDLTIQDLEGISKLLEYYDSTDDLDRRDQILEDLYNQIVTMKSALDYDLEQIDDSEYDRINDLVNQAICDDVQIVESFQPLFKQEEPEPEQQKDKIRERIQLANNSKTIKIPRRRKHAKKKYVVTRFPTEWDKDAINYDEIPIPNYNDQDYSINMGGDQMDCDFE